MCLITNLGNQLPGWVILRERDWTGFIRVEYIFESFSNRDRDNFKFKLIDYSKRGI